MLLAELVQDIRRVAAAVRGEGARDALQRPREVVDDDLLLAINAARILAQESRQLELDRAAARNNLLVLVRATHDHDSVVQRAIDLDKRSQIMSPYHSRASLFNYSSFSARRV